MPTVEEVLEIAKALGGRAVAVAPSRCVAVRNRHASCSRCADVCTAGAISVKDNEISVDDAACVACGSCVPACPTGAIVPLGPKEDELALAVARSASELGEGRAVIACARVASQSDGDPDKFAEVPCLARIGELMLVELAARGVADVALVDGGCDSCRYGKASAALDLALDEARALLAACGCESGFMRMSVFPADVLMPDEREQLAASRRSFLTNAGGMAKDAAVVVAEQTVMQKMRGNEAAEPPTLRSRLGLKEAGKLPTFKAERNLRLLDALYELGDGADRTLHTRVFGSVSVDAEKCSGCGMCVMFCPTGALAASQDEHPNAAAGSRYLEFSAADCVQCGLCVDVCIKEAVSLSPCVGTAELFDFEPRLLEARKPADKPRLFGRRR